MPYIYIYIWQCTKSLKRLRSHNRRDFLFLPTLPSDSLPTTFRHCSFFRCPPCGTSTRFHRMLQNRFAFVLSLLIPISWWIKSQFIFLGALQLPQIIDKSYRWTFPSKWEKSECTDHTKQPQGALTGSCEEVLENDRDGPLELQRESG